jgi:hypothetical protein
MKPLKSWGHPLLDKVGALSRGIAGVALRKARHVRTHVEYSYLCTTRTLSLNRLVTLPPGLYKVRQGPISVYPHHLENNTPSIKSYTTYMM